MEFVTAGRHQQKDPLSCIPMSVELVLKLLGRVPDSYYDLQTEWNNRRDGSFELFHNRSIKNVLFTARFRHSRNAAFPIDELFQAIDLEIASRRYVIISLASSGGWHMYVIAGHSDNGDYIAVTKQHPRGTVVIEDVKKRVCAMKGTDILTYAVEDVAV